jgi:hypothetical protein
MLSHGIVRMIPKFILINCKRGSHYSIQAPCSNQFEKKHVFVNGINKIIGNIFTKTFSNKGLHIQNNVKMENLTI